MFVAVPALLSRSDYSALAVLGHLRPAPDGHVLADLFMLVYTHRRALVRPRLHRDRALPSRALTLIGYFFIGESFELWMAIVNGGGLILGGLWMRRN